MRYWIKNFKLESHFGEIIAILIILFWMVSSILAFQYRVSFWSPYTYLWILVQMHLFTGLFITAHDSMHGTVSSNPRINHFLGWISSFCYACFLYSRLNHKHHAHHEHVHTDLDPDYSPDSFLVWYFKFFMNYFTIIQLATLIGLFFFLKLAFHIPEWNLILFWIIPSILSSLQLFYFGTYSPHKGNPGNRHHARSQNKNHVLAFFTCYFFGYHFEHHNAPNIPWWKLHSQKL